MSVFINSGARKAAWPRMKVYQAVCAMTKPPNFKLGVPEWCVSCKHITRKHPRRDQQTTFLDEAGKQGAHADS